MQFHYYKPECGVSADYIPFYENGVYYLFYLHDYRNWKSYGEGTPWYLITTRDFIHFEEHGEVLPRGTIEEQDLYVFTGSVTKIQDCYHIYYTGHNPYFRKKGLPEQGVMHAVSKDLLHWKKCPEDTFYAPQDRFEMHDWRDPFLYYDASESKYLMLLAARSKEGPSRRRGITALCSSADGLHWQTEDTFWEPSLYFTHECPDLFRMGDWYYLIFSEFSQEKVTRYRMSRNIHGPWITPPDDRFDGCGYYAAKSAGDGENRYLFGWLSTRENDRDDGAWQWGGCLVVHRLVQNPDGTLHVEIPQQLCATDSTSTNTSTVPEQSMSMNGMFVRQWKELGMLQETDSVDVCFDMQTESSASGESTESTDYTSSSHAQMEILFGCDADLDKGYCIRLELNRGRVVLDRWPRIAEHAFEAGLERPLPPAENGKYHCKLHLDGSAGCVYVNNRVALSFRMYAKAGDHWGISVENGEVHVSFRQA